MEAASRPQVDQLDELTESGDPFTGRPVHAAGLDAC